MARKWRTAKVNRSRNAKLKNFTLGGAIDAIYDNGYQKSIGRFWETPDEGNVLESSYLENDVVVGSACAVGQAALNLGVDYSDLATALERVSIPEIRAKSFGYAGGTIDSLGGLIYHLNDTRNWSPQAIASHIRRHYQDKVDFNTNLSASEVHVEVIE